MAAVAAHLFAMYEGGPRDSRISPDTFAKWAEAPSKEAMLDIDLIPEPVSGFPPAK
jgi:hypothetical protein